MRSLKPKDKRTVQELRERMAAAAAAAAMIVVKGRKRLLIMRDRAQRKARGGRVK